MKRSGPRASSLESESSTADAKREASASVAKVKVRSMSWGMVDLSDDGLWPEKPL